MSGEVWWLMFEICSNKLVRTGNVEVISNIIRQRANGDIGDFLLVEHIINYTLRFDVVD